MAVPTDPFSAWLAHAHIPEPRLSPDQRGLLLSAFRFRQSQGHDYYSSRLLSHFLLHADSGLKVAQLARLVGFSRPTASRQQNLSSKQAIQQAHHRMDGRPYGKLLPRFAGPIAGFLLSHPNASRADLLDFIDATFRVRVSRIALFHFLKKFGLDGALAAATPAGANPVPAALPEPSDSPTPPCLLPVPLHPVPEPAGIPAPPFCSERRSSRAPS
jgi:hypothetical protein